MRDYYSETKGGEMSETRKERQRDDAHAESAVEVEVVRSGR